MWQLRLPCDRVLLATGQHDGSAERQMPRHGDNAWLALDLFAYTVTLIDRLLAYPVIVP
jgi:hypothetical protein